jgi:predicted methyltransferase
MKSPGLEEEIMASRLGLTVLCASALGLLSAPARGAEVSAEALAAKLQQGTRTAEDRARDAGRRPAEVVAFLGIEPGMTVVDLIAAGGYYTEVLSVAVGPTGKVHAQNTAYVLEIRDGANDKALTARLAGGRLPNVERLDREVAALGLAPGSVDAAVTALNFHDIYNGSGREAADRFLAAVHRFLVPGGVLGLIDHSGNPGADNAKLHRIEESLVVASAKAAGFEVEERSDLLRNADDDRSLNVFDPAIRGRTDRFVLRLRKPR